VTITLTDVTSVATCQMACVPSALWDEDKCCWCTDHLGPDNIKICRPCFKLAVAGLRPGGWLIFRQDLTPVSHDPSQPKPLTSKSELKELLSAPTTSAVTPPLHDEPSNAAASGIVCEESNESDTDQRFGDRRVGERPHHAIETG